MIKNNARQRKGERGGARWEIEKNPELNHRVGANWEVTGPEVATREKDRRRCIKVRPSVDGQKGI